MPRDRKIPPEDKDKVQQLILEGTAYTDIASEYKTSRQVVYRYVKTFGLIKFTDITKEELLPHIRDLQRDNKQTHGFEMIKSGLAQRNIRVPNKFLEGCIRAAVPKLVELRDPRTGIRNINGPFPLLAAGPLYRVHYDQYEKLWQYGLMVYGGRDRFGRYVITCAVTRNKHSTSIKLVCVAGWEHMRGVPPFMSQFDCGTEGSQYQALLCEHIGADAIRQGTCKQNIVIEGFWRILHHGAIWQLRVELYHLQTIFLLDTVNPMHLSVVWSTYSHDAQWKIDDYTSTYNGKKIRKQNKYGIPSKKPVQVIRSLFKDISGNNFMNVIPATLQSPAYDEYVKQVNEYVVANSHKDSEPSSILLPSEMWITEERIEAKYDDDVDFGQNLFLNKEDWSDEDVKAIMKGRRNDIACEFLSVYGQQMRHQLVEGTMFQLLKIKVFDNESHYRMFKYAIARCATESILEKCKVDVKIYPNEQINKDLLVTKQQMWIGWEFLLEINEVEKEDMIHSDLLRE